ncbi:MAG: hypothetical protein Q8O76_15145 [Chloroflexota bacterium]|nr:hypothetical protein [Chloroflexota bacterium]
MARRNRPEGRAIVPGVDIERLHGKAAKLYLERELRELERRIDYLSQALLPQARQVERGTWPGELGQSGDDWEGILELKYLEAMERAILETLARL